MEKNKILTKDGVLLLTSFVWLGLWASFIYFRGDFSPPTLVWGLLMGIIGFFVPLVFIVDGYE